MNEVVGLVWWEENIRIIKTPKGPNPSGQAPLQFHLLRENNRLIAIHQHAVFQMPANCAS